jgi:hypothetical protein
MVPWVLYDTVMLAVRYVPAPIVGTVFAGTGAVCEMPTRGIPMPNAKCERAGIETRGVERGGVKMVGMRERTGTSGKETL